jgi:hypothetical protein
MIKLMQGKNVGMQLKDDGNVLLEIHGQQSLISVDDLEEIRTITDHFWSANNLYNQTSEAKKDRERHETEWGRSLTLSGQQTASKG